MRFPYPDALARPFAYSIPDSHFRPYTYAGAHLHAYSHRCAHCNLHGYACPNINSRPDIHASAHCRGRPHHAPVTTGRARRNGGVELG